MRIRTIKPEFWTNEKLCSLSLEAHTLAAGLLNYADDEGWFNANIALVKGALFPLRDVDIQSCLDELEGIRYIELHEIDNRVYGFVREFKNHQVISRPSPSKIATIVLEAAKLHEDSMRTHGGLHEDSMTEQGTGNGEQGTEQGLSRRRDLPTLEEWRAEWAKHGGSPKTADAPWYHYEARNWHSGKTPITKWRMCVHTCLRTVKPESKAVKYTAEELAELTQ